MSYRIHLSLLSKNDIEKAIETAYTYKESEGYIYLELPNNRIEIIDTAPIGHLPKVFPKETIGYHPYYLSKPEFRKLLIYYQKHIVNNAQIQYAKIDEINETYKNKEQITSLDKSLNKKFYYTCITNISETKSYFEKLLKENKLLDDSSLFIIQYFYLVKLYETFNEDTHVMVVSHG